MNQLIENITSHPAGDPAANAMLMTMASLLLISVGQILLARRNDLGWWVVMLGYFAGPVAIALYPGMSDYWLLLGALAQFACAAVGLYGFSRSELVGRFTRRVHHQRFSVMALLGLLVLTLVVGVLQFGQALTSPKALFVEGSLTPWLNVIFSALIAVAFVGIGFGARWAWFLSAVGGAGQVALTAAQPVLAGAGEPLFVLLLAFVLVLLTALYGFFAWGAPLPQKPTSDTEPDTEQDAEPGSEEDVTQASSTAQD